MAEVGTVAERVGDGGAALGGSRAGLGGRGASVAGRGNLGALKMPVAILKGLDEGWPVWGAPAKNRTVRGLLLGSLVF